MTHSFSINNRNFLVVAITDKEPATVAKALIAAKIGKHIPIGFYPGMTEEQAAGIVELFKTNSGNVIHGRWVNYLDKAEWCRLPIESFASKMAAEKIYFVNPHGEQPQKLDFEIQPGSKIYDNTFYVNALNDWQAAQLRTSKVFVIIEDIKTK